jgi:2'-5' RNA ligase
MHHETIRAFVATQLDIAASRRVADLARRARAARSAPPQASWVSPVHHHITLRFLGDIDPGLAPAIGDMMRARLVVSAPVKVRLKGLGAFPRLDAARSLFVAIDDPQGTLGHLLRGLSAGLDDLGLDPEKQPFVPHLTLARFRAPVDLRPLAAEVGKLDPEARCSECTLFRSDLRPSGSLYTALSVVPLTPRKPSSPGKGAPPRP